MNPDQIPSDYAQGVVEAYGKGIICAGEVWNLIVDNATPSTMNQYIAKLTPELHRYLLQVVLVHYEPRSDQERVLLHAAQSWYAAHPR